MKSKSNLGVILLLIVITLVTVVFQKRDLLPGFLPGFMESLGQNTAVVFAFINDFFGSDDGSAERSLFSPTLIFLVAITLFLLAILYMWSRFPDALYSEKSLNREKINSPAAPDSPPPGNNREDRKADPKPGKAPAAIALPDSKPGKDKKQDRVSKPKEAPEKPPAPTLEKDTESKPETQEDLLAFAALSGPAAGGKLSDIFGRAAQSFLTGAELNGKGKADDQKGFVPPQSPDHLANQAVLNWIDLAGNWKKTAKKAARANPDAFFKRLSNLSKSKLLLLPEHREKLAQLWSVFKSACPEFCAWLHEQFENDLMVVAQDSSDVTEIQEALARIQHYADSRPFDQSISLKRAEAAVSAMLHYGTLGQFEAMEEWGKHISELARNLPEDQQIQHELAMATVNATSTYGTMGQFEAMEEWGNAIKELARKWPEDQDIQHELAIAAVNAMGHYGTASQFDGLEDWSQQMEELAEQWPEDQPIQLQLARGAVNAIHDYGEANQLDTLEEWCARMEELAEKWPDDPAIQLRLAMAAVNATSTYGNLGQFEAMENWGNRMKALAEQWPQDRQIQLRHARTAANAINAYGDSGQFDALEDWGDRIKTLAREWPDEPQMQLELAMAAVNATSTYGNAGQHNALETWGIPVVELAEQWPDNQKIQLQLAKTAHNALLAYGNRDNDRDGDKHAVWLERLRQCALDNFQNADITAIAENNGIELSDLYAELFQNAGETDRD
ncbi:hypothetical protein [Kiloniella sp. b19]|uniref:hypothetical protein n=1 Tax=Kiloniella sp. GXU_MW_B19 TaxID=3141326 RepID=UPI0031D3B3AA